MSRVIEWIRASDWHWFAVFVVAQVMSVAAFLWFAVWLSEFAKLNWY